MNEANDNVKDVETTNVPTDEQCMEVLSNLLANRLQLGVGYLQEGEEGYLTHSVLTIRCGELYMQTDPSPLPCFFIPVKTDNAEKVLH